MAVLRKRFFAPEWVFILGMEVPLLKQMGRSALAVRSGNRRSAESGGVSSFVPRPRSARPAEARHVGVAGRAPGRRGSRRTPPGGDLRARGPRAAHKDRFRGRPAMLAPRSNRARRIATMRTGTRRAQAAAASVLTAGCADGLRRPGGNVTGTNRGERLVGTDGSDYIKARGGNDKRARAERRRHRVRRARRRPRRRRAAATTRSRGGRGVDARPAVRRRAATTSCAGNSGDDHPERRLRARRALRQRRRRRDRRLARQGLHRRQRRQRHAQRRRPAAPTSVYGGPGNDSHQGRRRQRPPARRRRQRPRCRATTSTT